MDDKGEMDPGLLASLRALRVAAAPRPGAANAARAAMHGAVTASVASRAGWSWRRRHSRLRMRLVFAGVAGAAGAGVVVGGWSAAAGSPLHVVQVAREDVSLGFSGSGRLQLLLSYADQRLAQWRFVSDPAQCLLEARGYLLQAKALLPDDPHSAVYEHWIADERISTNAEQELAREQDAGPPLLPGATTPTAGPGSTHGRSSRQPAANGHGTGAPSPDGQNPGGDSGSSDGHHHPSPSGEPSSSPPPEKDRGHSPGPSPSPSPTADGH